MLYNVIIAIIISLTVWTGALRAEDTAIDTLVVSDTALTVSDTATADDDAASAAADTAIAVSDSAVIMTDTADAASAAGDTATAANDSTAVMAAAAAAADSIRAKRLAAYGPPQGDDRTFVTSPFDRTSVFRGDGAGVSEALRYRSLTSVHVPYTLSSSMNRSLHYGNTAHGWQPLSVEAPATLFLMAPRRFHGSDGMSASQASDFFSDGMRDGLLYLPYPDMISAPELHVFWENGVFEQNTFNLRLTRPLGRSVMISAFSDYRYLSGTRFNHERNDIVSLYETFNSDTSTIMNYGYNPLVDEHTMGAALLWTGSDSSRIRAGFTYAGAQNEYALDTLAESIDRLAWANLSSASSRIDAALLDKKVGSSRLNLKTAYIGEDFESSYKPDTTLEYAMWGGKLNSVLFDANIVTPIHVGFKVDGLISTFENLAGKEDSISKYNAEIFYDRRIQLPRSFLGDVNLRAFIGTEDLDTLFYDGTTFLELGAAADFLPGKRSFIRRYTGLSRLSAYIRSRELGAFGGETQFESKYHGLLLGYQFTGNDKPVYAWPMSKPPYDQPNRTLLVAPWTARFAGFALSSRTFITDTKPHVKTTTVLSHLIQPRGMAHAFETELGFDYWSERDPVTFGGIDDYNWGGEIYDVNLKVTAHIKSFRLFYKVDNILNLRQAYIPGYFSPGLTFRWGINWFLM